jgi:hypothetical protein
MTTPERLEEILLVVVIVFLQIFLEAYILGTLFHYIVKKDAAVEAFRVRQGLTLVHFSAQPDLLLVTEPLELPSISLERCLR